MKAIVVILFAILLLATLFTVWEANSASVREVKFPHVFMVDYPVFGSSEAEVRTNMSILGPRGYDAWTGWTIHWDWPGKGTENCQLDKAKVTSSVYVIFPRWLRPSHAPQELVEKWQRYNKALGEHELEHVSMVSKNIDAIRTSIMRATCTTAEQAAETALKNLQAQSDAYDQATGHGVTQGAIFP
jgi:predicted secreted Zn-dependent protease